jgi:hypothetical protein
MTTTQKPLTSLILFLVLAAALLLSSSSSTASAANPVGKDGRIHACYKAKGKGKGTLRLVGRGKARCPRKWRKVTWQARPTTGPRGEAGAPGRAGQPGPTGASGADATTAVLGLESQLAQLLVKVETLEGILAGVTNQGLLGAIAAVPAVGALCEQTEGLTGQVDSLLTSVGGLNSLLDTLLVLFDPVGLPTALPAFSCPTG